MEQRINSQLEIIEKSIKWVTETDSMRGSKGDNAYRNLVNFRRRLNKKKFALEGNPAAVIYGASQVGKSYLVSNLLAENGNPLTIIDGQNKPYVFLDEINPFGEKKEATSLVTRFSTNYKSKNVDFPIRARLLSPIDLVLVLCDSYYNNVKPKFDNTIKSDTISEKITEICNKYESISTKQTLFSEDNVLDIHDYFKSNFSRKATDIINSQFFNKIPSLIAKMQPNEWSEIFALLWNNNTKITNFFSDLLKQYAELDFSEEIYLPINAVLRNKGTLLDVVRLLEIYGECAGIEQNYEADTSLLILKNGQERRIDNFSKSYLCALTAELTFCLPKQLETTKTFLKSTDLLDFPGARNHMGRHEEEIVDKDIPGIFLRGKVAYLFNKYSYSEKINILLFCQNNEKSELQNILPDLLNNWINDMIGKTMEERNTFIEKSKVPPIFVVSTMFNIDLKFDYNKDGPGPGAIDARNKRWNDRFFRVFNEVFGSKKWFSEWTTSNNNFQNIYLLRDFRYSSDTECKLFKGYNEEKREIKEIFNDSYPDFRKNLRKSFIECDFVKKHFENPENSWDEAASINKDGTQLIIDNLIIAANNINTARHEKTIFELNIIAQNIVDELKKYYKDSNSDKLLQEAKSTAGYIRGKLDIAFGQNPYFFGTMMKGFMLNNSNVYNLYIEKIRDIERRDVVNMDKYSAIRINVRELNPNDSFDTNLERLRKHYDKQTTEECKKYFKNENIDLNELFYGNNERVKNFSQVLTESLETYWFEKYMLESKQNLSNIFSEIGLQDIQDMLRALFRKLKISKIIAEKIRGYVDGYRSIENVYEMIADISAEIINKFINTIGFEYFTESDFADLKQANEQNSLELILEHDELHFKQNSRVEAAELITKMGNLPELLNKNPLPKNEIKLLPNYRNYIIWYDLLKVGFVSVCDIPNYDVQANEKLRIIKEECEKLIKDGIKP